MCGSEQMEFKLVSGSKKVEINLIGLDEKDMQSILKHVTNIFYSIPAEMKEPAAIKAIEEAKPKTHGFAPNIKIKDGKECYQLYYICTDCGDKGKNFVWKGTKYTPCHNCKKRLSVRPATIEKGFIPDQFGNYYIAGDYYREDESIEEVMATERFLNYASN